jgi:hypothetical protein
MIASLFQIPIDQYKHKQQPDIMRRPDALTQFMTANQFSSRNLVVFNDNALIPPSLPEKPKLHRRISRRLRIERQGRYQGQVAPPPQLCRWGSLPIEASSLLGEPAAFSRHATFPLPDGSSAPPRRPQRQASLGFVADCISPAQTDSASCPRRPQRKASLSDSNRSSDLDG